MRFFIGTYADGDTIDTRRCRSFVNEEIINSVIEKKLDL